MSAFSELVMFREIWLLLMRFDTEFCSRYQFIYNFKVQTFILLSFIQFMVCVLQAHSDVLKLSKLVLPFHHFGIHNITIVL